LTAADRLRERRARHQRRSLPVRIATVLAGFGALVGGGLLLVLPGPGIPLIVVGLGLLALEFTWAERPLAFALRHAERVTPTKRSHRVAMGVAVVAALAASLTVALLLGVPGF
jgi:uncharacterized protein (TIGR02611 family)